MPKRTHNFPFWHICGYKLKNTLAQYLVSGCNQAFTDEVDVFGITGFHYEAQRTARDGSVDAYALMSYRYYITAELSYDVAHLGKHSGLV